EDGPGVDDRLHPLGIAAVIRVEPQREGAERGPDRRPIRVGWHVEDGVEI
ncbi:MAG: hypothetical protein QOE66_2569, partial [Chloroflexota bacterium]|nr:hypothetical protein [Chloroflexota bacterium]